MNQLSWLLYWGNVAGNLGMALIFFGCICVVLTIAQIIIHFGRLDAFKTAVQNMPHAARQEMEQGQKSAYFKTLPRLRTSLAGAYVSAVFVFVFWTGATFCPSSDTVYAIAASQMGEQVLKTPIAGKVQEALTGWLQRQINVNKANNETSPR